MEYRELGRTGKQVSLMSLGCMRLPDDDEDGAKIVSRAVDLGINYFETSEGYCRGRSEIKVGMGVKGRRDQVLISTKSTFRAGTTADDIKRKIEESLKRLDMDRVDFYQIWDFKIDDFETVTARGGGLDTLEALRDEGIIGHIGATSHETNENIIRMLDTDRLESITLSYHMLNRSIEPVVEHAGAKGIGVVAMTPLAGGLLATPSEILAELVPGQKSSSAASAFRYLMSNPHVSTIPSGMKCISDVEENVRTWKDFRPLSHEQRDEVIRRLDEYQSLGEKFCTGCGYCAPCPSGVNITRSFQIRNYCTIFGMQDWANRAYGRMKDDELPENCTECGECETKCPNQIPIIDQLKAVVSMFRGVRA